MITKEQKARLIEYRDKWLNIGLCTEPADRQIAEDGIRLMYKTAGHHPPKIIWGRSPAEIITKYKKGKNTQSIHQLIRENVEIKAWIHASNTINPKIRQLATEIILDGGQRTALMRIGEHIWSIGNNGYSASSIEHALPFCQ